MKRIIVLLAALAVVLNLHDSQAQRPSAKERPQTPAETAALEHKQLQIAINAAKGAHDLRTLQELQEQLDNRQETPDHRPGGDPALDQGGENCGDAVDLSSLPLPILQTGTNFGFNNDFDCSTFGAANPPCWLEYYNENSSCAGPDVTYTWTAPADGDYVVSLCGSFYDTGLMIFNNTCPSPPSYPADWICGDDDGCQDGLQSQASFSLAAGQNVLIVVDGWNTESGDYLLLIDEAQPAPPNDACANAQFVEPIPGNQVVVNGTTESAQPDFIVDCLGNTINSPGVWYAVPGTGGTMTASLCNPSTEYDSRLTVLTGNCDEEVWECIVSNDDFCGLQSLVQWCTEPTTLYYIHVAGYSAGDFGPFELIIEDDGVPCDVPPPPNDLCENAQPLLPGPPLPGTLFGATPDGPPPCPLPLPPPPDLPGVWYGFTGTGEQMLLSTCITGDPLIDLHMTLFQGDCSNPQCLFTNDDACGLLPEIELCTEPGVDYLLHVTGPLPVDFQIELLLPGDLCPLYDIPQIYAAGQSIIGTEVRLRAFTTTEGIIVTDFDRYNIDEPFPPGFYLDLTDEVLIDPENLHGVRHEFRGVVLEQPDPGDAENNLLLSPTEAVPLTAAFPVIEDNWRDTTNWVFPADCDTCKFALLISGGASAPTNARGATGGSNRADYWDNLADFYCYKRANGWCEANTKVFYYKGARPAGHTRMNDIPAGVVDSCWQDKIQAHIDAIKSKIAACRDSGKASNVEVMVTNHGEKSPGAGMEGGITMVNSAAGGDTIITPTEFTAMMQSLVDSGLTALSVEMGQCYSGQMINHLNSNLNPKGCNVTAGSSVDANHTAWSFTGDGGFSQWLNALVCALATGADIQEAMNIANRTYDWRRRNSAHNHAQRAAEYRANAAASLTLSDWADWIDCAQDADQDSLDHLDGIGGQQYYRAFQCTTWCHAETLQVTPGGRITIKWAANDSSCGNAEVLCQDSTDKKFRREAYWNWNTPGSRHFEGGNNQRQLESDSAHTGIYIFHARTHTPFNVTVTSQNPPLSVTDPSNPETFAGFSVGWRQGTSDEFGEIMSVAHTLPDADDDGFNLATSPKILGPGGVSLLTVNFDVVQENYWWENMELRIEVLDAAAGTELSYNCLDCEVQAQTAVLSGGPEYVTMNVGSINSAGSHSILLSSDGDVELDCWGLESAQSTSTPAAVTELVVFRSGDDVSLSWDAVPLATSYLIQVATTPGGPWSDLDTTAGTTYTHANQVNALDELYFYRVIAQW